MAPRPEIYTTILPQEMKKKCDNECLKYTYTKVCMVGIERTVSRYHATHYLDDD